MNFGANYPYQMLFKVLSISNTDKEQNSTLKNDKEGDMGIVPFVPNVQPASQHPGHFERHWFRNPIQVWDVNLQENVNLDMTSHFYHIIFHLVSSFRAILAYQFLTLAHCFL